MGTWVDMIHRPLDARSERRLQDELDASLRRYEVDYYAWADGELARLNTALAAGRSFEASGELTTLLARARVLSARSEAFFDPGVGALVEAWGFHTGDNPGREPPAEFLADWAADPPGIADLRISGNRIAGDRALIVDLGGIAKGEVVDRLLERFSAAGARDVLINAGGDVRVLGSRGERGWTVGIQSPRDPEAIVGSIALRDGEAVFTSGDYERFFDTSTGRRHHLLDPRSGRPATHTQAVTVVAQDGVTADAAATALFVAGPRDWRRIAAALGIEHVLRIDADGTLEMTPAMRDRVSMQPLREPATIH